MESTLFDFICSWLVPETLFEPLSVYLKNQRVFRSAGNFQQSYRVSNKILQDFWCNRKGSLSHRTADVVVRLSRTLSVYHRFRSWRVFVFIRVTRLLSDKPSCHSTPSPIGFRISKINYPKLVNHRPTLTVVGRRS